MSRGDLRHTFLERLMHYYDALQAIRRDRSGEWVASVEIARQLNLDDSQVRRDLGRLGLRGHPRLGFRQDEVLDVMTSVMGLDRAWTAAIIGVGRLGSALASYEGFSVYGLSIVGLFDADRSKVWKRFGELTVEPFSDLGRFLSERQVDIGIITVPSQAAQVASDALVQGGVKALWNFAPVNLDVPDDVFVRNEHISVGLAELAYSLTAHIPAS